MTFNIAFIPLTSRGFIEFQIGKNSLISLQSILQSATRSQINNTIKIYDENGILISQFTVQTTTNLLLNFVKISKIQFWENTSQLYTIHNVITNYNYSDKNVYNYYKNKASIEIQPILFGQVGI